MFYDWTWFIILPGIILAMIAQTAIQGRYRKYSKVAARSGLTGAELASRILESEGIYDIPIEQMRGELTDHYDPEHKTLRLSEGVGASNSIAALGIAAHETGHVLQHRDGYAPLMLRASAAPIASIGSNLSWILVLLGFLIWDPLVTVGIFLFAIVVLYTLITLPVEFNASRRAMAVLEGGGYLAQDELDGARKVLNAAALTYVASALTAILQLVRLLMISGGRRRR